MICVGNRDEALFFAAYFLIACLVTWPLVLNFSSMIYGSFGDSNLSLLALETMGENGMITQSVSAPFGETITQHYYRPVYAYILLPLSRLSSPVVAHNLFVFLSFPLSGIAMYLFSRRFVASKRVSFIVGFAFAFSPFHLFTATAMPTKAQIWVVPLFAYALMRFDAARNAINALLLAFAGFASAFVSYYLFFFSLIFSGIFCFYKALKATAFSMRDLKHLALAVAVFSALFLAFVYPFVYAAVQGSGAAGSMGVASASRGNLMSAVYSSAWPAHFVVPSVYSSLLGWLSLPFISSSRVGVGYGSTSLYLGATILALAAYALVKKKGDRAVEMLLFFAVGTFIFATGPFMRYVLFLGLPVAVAPIAVALYFAYKRQRGTALCFIALATLLVFLPLAYFLLPSFFGFAGQATGIAFSEFSEVEVIEHLDKYQMFPIPMPSFFSYKLMPIARAYTNMAVWVMLFVALIAGVGLQALLDGMKPRAGAMLSVLVFVLVFAEFVNVPPSRTTDLSAIPDEYRWLRGQPGDFIAAEYPLGYDALYSYYQAVHGKRLFNGMFNKETERLQKQLHDLSSPEVPQKLFHLGIKYVIVHDETLCNRIPSNFVEHADVERWYLDSERSKAAHQFLKQYPQGTDGLKPVKRFKHATVFAVRRVD